MGKNISKKLSYKYSQKLLDHAKQSTADELKTASKKQNQLVILLVTESRIKLHTFQKVHYSIAQWQLEVKQKTFDLIENYQEKHIYHQKQYRKLLVIKD